VTPCVVNGDISICNCNQLVLNVNTVTTHRTSTFYPITSRTSSSSSTPKHQTTTTTTTTTTRLPSTTTTTTSTSSSTTTSTPTPTTTTTTKKAPPAGRPLPVNTSRSASITSTHATDRRGQNTSTTGRSQTASTSTSPSTYSPPETTTGNALTVGLGYLLLQNNSQLDVSLWTQVYVRVTKCVAECQFKSTPIMCCLPHPNSTPKLEKSYLSDFRTMLGSPGSVRITLLKREITFRLSQGM